MDVTTTLNQAITAARAGRKAEARRLLETLLAADERNEQAWLWMSGVVDSDEERIVCLENVLTINPSNERAGKGLASIKAPPTQTPYQADDLLKPPAPSPAQPPSRPQVADYRLYIAIIIVLSLMLICTVFSIVAAVALLAPPV